MLNKFTLIVVVAFGLFFSAGQPAYPQTKAKTLLIVKPGDAEPIHTIIKNVRSSLKGTDPDLTIEEITVNTAEDAINRAAKINPTVIFLVGKDIGKKLAENIATVPIVISDMFRPAYVETFPNNRFVVESLYVKPETNIDYIQKMLFDVKTIAIVYNSEKNSDVVDDAEKYAQNHDLSIKRFPVNSEKDIRNIPGLKSDAMLLIPDTLVCNPVSLKRIMELCLQEKIPMMGISEYFAQTGTVMATAPDFDEYSKRAADTLSRILRGTPPSAIPAGFPEKVDYFINAAMARTKNITFKPGIMTGAKKVFGQ